jgi:osmoprotectant transport system substrate-binding protein
MRTSLIARGVAMLAGFALALTACGGGSDPLSSGSGQTSGAAAPSDTIVVGSANFTESQILAEIYAQALAAKGVTVEKRLNIGSREAYIPGLQDGSIDLIPEYSGVLLQYFDKTADETAPDAVYTALQAALPDNLIVLDKSAAEDKDAVVVTRDTATRLNVKSIADLAPQCPTLVFGGAPEFQTRPDGIPGIQATYNCAFKEFRSLDAGGPLTVAALKNGDVPGREPVHHAVHDRGERLRRAGGPEEQLRGPERAAADQQGEGDRQRQDDAERDLGEADDRGPHEAQRRGRRRREAEPGDGGEELAVAERPGLIGVRARRLLEIADRASGVLRREHRTRGNGAHQQRARVPGDLS